MTEPVVPEDSNGKPSLSVFLNARLDEDEAAAHGVPPGPWYVSAEREKGYPQSIFNNANILIAQTFSGPEFPPMEADYIARHDPARVLREVEAKRRILADHPSWEMRLRRCNRCIEWAAGIPQKVAWPCPTVRALALVYSDHPDYDPAWA